MKKHYLLLVALFCTATLFSQKQRPSAEPPQEGIPTATTKILNTTETTGCDPEPAPMGNQEFELSVLGSYATGIFDEGAAEIVAYDPGSARLFFTNSDANSVTILDISNPATPILFDDISMDPYGDGVNSLDVFNGAVAIAVQAEAVDGAGTVVFMDVDGVVRETVEVGVLPDMLTFTPDGTKVITANEGEPSDDYLTDPEGSVSVIDVSGGVTGATAETITFEQFNDRRASLLNKGVRIFGPGATVAQDLEPEYVTIVDDSLAYVSCQENNALVVININSLEVLDILALGAKDYNSGQPRLTNYVLNELLDLPPLGTPTYGGGQPTVFLGGFSGLTFAAGESTDEEYVFYTVPDRGPNDGAVSRGSVTPEPPGNLRPFKLPDYQGRIIRFTLNPQTGVVALTESILLTRQDGTTPISGRGNIEGFDEVPVAYSERMPGDIFYTDFQDTTFGMMETVSVTSNENWELVNSNGDFQVQMNGFGADEASEDWLISPALDYSGSAFLSFISSQRFEGGSLNLLVSTDYDGGGDPTSATWTDITDQAVLSAGSSVFTFSEYVDISDFASSSTYVAFQYLSTGTEAGDAASWRLDEISVGSSTGIDFVDDAGNEYRALPFDAFGGDFEGIQIDNDGNFWMVDEYRPAIYKFQPDGTLIERYVPEGTSTLGLVAEPAGTFGAETLPAIYAKRRANRGFEALAFDSDANIMYAFIQSPIEAPDRATIRGNSDVIRILGVDAATGMPVSEYIYLLEQNAGDGINISAVDKIGDAVYIGNGQMQVLERDSSNPDQPNGKKFIFTINLTGATNTFGSPESTEDGSTGMTLEQMSADDLAAAGIVPVAKNKLLNLPSIGYLASDKPEGLAALPNNALAVLNDNDFGLAGAGITDNSILGIIEFCSDNAIDASNRAEEINIRNWPVLSFYQPDAITSYEVDGRSYIVTANEGDARDYDDFSEEERVGDLMLDPTAYPDAATIQNDTLLGRLLATTANGDYDGDGDFDQIFGYGARSFSIFDDKGNLVFDSGNDFARIIAELDPDNFNSNNDDNDSRKSRSDDKGIEPEAVAIATQGDATYALIGLERYGGIMVYNVTDPSNPYFVNFVNNRNFDVDAESAGAGDLGVEDVVFVPAVDSPNGEPLVVTANEVSGTVTVFGVGDATGSLQVTDGNGRVLVNSLTDGTVIDLQEIGNVPLNIKSTPTRSVGSVVFDLDGPIDITTTENFAPYFLFGNPANLGNTREVNYAREFPVGSYTLTVTAYSGNGGGGDVVATRTVSFEVVLNAAIDRFVLFDDAGTVLDDNLEDGETIVLSEISNNALNIEAITDPAIVGSVVFDLQAPGNLSRVRTENIVPYAVFGNGSRPFVEGDYTLTAIPYQESNAGGAAGTAATINFSVVAGDALAGTEVNLANGAIATDALQLDIYPNPARLSATLQLTSKLEGAAQVRIIDLSGRIVQDIQFNKVGLVNRRPLSLDGLNSGVYQVQVTVDNETVVSRLVITQ